MKKKFLIPCLLLAGSLTACDSGLVTKGEPYKEGDAAKVSEAIKTETQGKVKGVKIKSTTEMDMVVKAAGEKESVSAETVITADINLDDKSIEMDVVAKAKGAGTSATYKASAKAKYNNGTFNVTDKSGDFDQISGEFDFSGLYEATQTEIYSWNFSLDTAELNDVMAELGSSTSALGNDIAANILIDGDAAKGTFDVGLSKELSGKFNLSSAEAGVGMDMNFTFKKMKFSFKDYLIRSGVVAMKADGGYNILGNAVDYSYDLSSSTEYSYTLK